MPVTNVHPLFSEWFTVNGESMATYGWSVESVTTGLPERKGENVTSPIMHGSMFREKRFGPRTDTWNIWVCDADPVTGVIPDAENDKRAQFNENMDYVNRIFNSLTPVGLENGSLLIEKHYQIFTPQIGDIGPGGGYIFITPTTVGNTTGKYFEVAPFSTEVSRIWAQPAYQNALITGADGLILGTGYQNTLDIVNQGNNDPALSAAKYCDVLTYGGVSDWFLPSKNEINAIRTNLIYPLNLGDFNSLAPYASSSEYDANEIWAQTLNISATVGTQFRYFKDASYNVRAVRSFTFTEDKYLNAYAEVSGSYSYEDAKQFNCATFSVEITYPNPLWQEPDTATFSLTGSSVPLTYSVPSVSFGNAPVTSMVITITANGGAVVNPIITNGVLSNYPSQIGYTGTIPSGQSVVIDTSNYTVTLNSNNAISSVFRGGYRQEWFEFLAGVTNPITVQSTSGNFTVSFAYKKAYL